MSFSAIILAGTRPGGDPLARAQGVAHKGLIPLGGEPMLTRIVAAVREAGADRVAVSCDDPQVVALARSLGCEVTPPARGPSGSILAAAPMLPPPWVITTSDHALLRGEWVEELIAATPVSASLSVMLARRQEVEAALPESRRTYLRMADGDWSGCNLFFLRDATALRAIELWRQIEAARKRPWKIAARLGLRTLFDYARGRLGLEEALIRLGHPIGVVPALVPASDGLAAVDVDTPADLDDIRRLLGIENA